MSSETKEEAIKNHNGWGRSMWLTKESSKEGKQRALEIARLAGDEEAVAYLEGLLR